MGNDAVQREVLPIAFTGTIKFIRVDLGEDNHDHLIDPEIKAELAMTRQ